MSLKSEIRALQDGIRDGKRMQQHIKYIGEIITKKEVKLKQLQMVTEQKKQFLNELLLDKTGLRFYFEKILKSNSPDVELEKQDLLNSVLDLKDVEIELATLYFERDILQRKFLNAKMQRDRLEELYLLRKSELQSGSDPERLKLLSLDRLSDKYDGELKEIEEACVHAEQLLRLMQTLIDALKKIADWKKKVNSVEYPRQLKNIPDYADYSKDIAAKVQISIDKFQLELKDVWRHKELDFKDRFIAFDEFIFTLNKNLIFDWIVKQKIDRAAQGVHYIKNETMKIKIELEKLHLEIGQKRTRCSKEIDDLMAGW